MCGLGRPGGRSPGFSCWGPGRRRSPGRHRAAQKRTLFGFGELAYEPPHGAETRREAIPVLEVVLPHFQTRHARGRAGRPGTWLRPQSSANCGATSPGAACSHPFAPDEPEATGRLAWMELKRAFRMAQARRTDGRPGRRPFSSCWARKPRALGTSSRSGGEWLGAWGGGAHRRLAERGRLLRPSRSAIVACFTPGRGRRAENGDPWGPRIPPRLYAGAGGCVGSAHHSNQPVQVWRRHGRGPQAGLSIVDRFLHEGRAQGVSLWPSVRR